MSGDLPPRACCFGLFRRRQVWLPSLRGSLVLGLVAIALGVIVTLNLYPFLAVNEPFERGPLVVEGFAGTETFQDAIAEFHKHAEPKLYVTGGKLDIEFPVANLHNQADMAAWQLEQLGFPAESIQKVPAPGVRRDRTFASAVAVRDFMQAHGGVPAQLTIVTIGPHARRSRLMFQRAFGSATRIGVIATPDGGYDTAQWWRYSQGFRVVCDETIAYLYAKFLFWGWK